MFKFVGMKLLDDEQQKLKDSAYFYFILNGRTSFYRKFESKTILSTFRECKMKYVDNEPVSVCIFKVEKLNIRKKKDRPFDRSRKRE